MIVEDFYRLMDEDDILIILDEDKTKSNTCVFWDSVKRLTEEDMELVVTGVHILLGHICLEVIQ